MPHLLPSPQTPIARRPLLPLAALLLFAGYHLTLALTPPTPPLAPFANLPPATRQNLPPQPIPNSTTIALLGDLAPTNAASDKYLKLAVNQLNLLRPNAVFTVGNLVPGLTRSGQTYAHSALALHALLDPLQMPWFPCPGQTDIQSGTRDPADRRFEDLYQKYFGPLYFSTDCGNVHVIVLDSEESPSSPAISDAQFTWLKNDLAKTFERHAATPNTSIPASSPAPRPTPYVIVLLHRPLWRITPKDRPCEWDRVHDLLVDFNRRPIVTVEGMDAAAAPSQATGPRVVAVYAGAARAYSEEPARDGIHYIVLGAAAARLDQDAAVQVRHFTLLKFDDPPPAPSQGSGVHPVLLQLAGPGPGGEAAGTISPADLITARERTILDQIAALPNEALGTAGALDPPSAAGDPKNPPDTLRLLLNNPLDVPLDVELRLASTRNLATATLRENANPYAESFDTPWELHVPYLARHLEPGVKETYRMSLTCPPPISDTPPQLEFIVHWTDTRGRVHDILLKRKIPLIPHAAVPFSANPALDGDADWQNAATGAAYAWNLRGDEPRERSPEWEIVASADTVFFRITVEDPVKSYWPDLNLHSPWPGLPSDAVAIAWARAPDSPPASAQRLTIVPFAPKTPALYTNTGVGETQTPLQPLDPKQNIKTHLDPTPDGYTLTVALPKKLLLAQQPSCVLNLNVNDNDEGAISWLKSWAPETAGPKSWARLTFPPPATQPAASRPAETKPAHPRIP